MSKIKLGDHVTWTDGDIQTDGIANVLGGVVPALRIVEGVLEPAVYSAEEHDDLVDFAYKYLGLQRPSSEGK